MFEPIPKVELKIDRKRTTTKTSGTSDNDALMQYLLRPISTLSCFVSDAQNMAEAPGFDWDGIYMLGTHPCRTVRLVGLVVGVWEPDSGKKCFATLDDGSGVIDCCIPYIKVDQTKTVLVQETRDPRSRMLEKGKGATKMSDYYSKDTKAPPRRPAMFTEPSEWEPRFLVPDIGDTIRVEGKPRTKFGERVVLVDKLERLSTKDELAHWQQVVESHTTKYSQQFVIPEFPPPSPRKMPKKRTRVTSVATPKPSRRFLPPPNVGVSGISDFNAVEHITQTKPTDAQFPPRSSTCAVPSTPRRSSPVAPPSFNKPSSVSGCGHVEDKIPLLRHPSRLHSRDLTSNTFRIYVKHFMDRVTGVGPCQEHTADAFTLSYLRRVPELAELARRIARNSRKRKARDEKEKEKLKMSSSSRRLTRPSTKVDTKAADAKTAKRLFIMTLRLLYDEGSIVFSDGHGNRKWDAEEAGWLQDREEEIWKVRPEDDTRANITHTTVGSTSITSTTIGHGTRQTHVDDPELSEPDPGEEGYIPVTPPILVQPILGAIRSVVLQKGKITQGGATAGEVLEILRGRVDERWARISEWAIENALEMMGEDEVVRKSAQGRWTVT